MVGTSRLLLAVLASLVTSSSEAMVIVGWDTSRGGNASVSSSPGYSATRSMISTYFPGSTILGVNQLTSTALAGADVVWIGVGAGDTTSVAALTSSEQGVLDSFVRSGGTAMLFGDNDTFSGAAPAAMVSMFGMFGVHSTGTLSSTQGYTIIAPATYPMTGPVGTVTSLSSNYPGWFDVLPVGATVLARLTSNSQPAIVHIPAGALQSGSGQLWLFSDSGSAGSGGSSGTAWNSLFGNMISTVPEPASLGVVATVCLLLTKRRPAD